jgi:phage gp29-like protein
LPLDPARHIVHRAHPQVGIRDNFGGPLRAALFWWFLAGAARDWYGRALERYGAPFTLAHTDLGNEDAVNKLREALSESTRIFGLIVDPETQVELKEAALQGMTDGYERFIELCNREISKLIVGQTLSATPAATGLGSGVAALQAAVREDIRLFDQMRLAETLESQLFRQMLTVNGIEGRAPRIVFGGLSDDDAKKFADTLVSLKQAGLEPTDDTLQTVIPERVGIEVQRVASIAPPAFDQSQPGFMRAPEMHARDLKIYAAQRRLAGAVGVPAEWLDPLRAWFDKVESLAARKDLSDSELLNLLEEAVKTLPEVFSAENVDALARAFEIGMSQAVIEAVRQRLREKASR